MKCRYCDKDIGQAGPMTMHEMTHPGYVPRAAFVAATALAKASVEGPKAAASPMDAVIARVDALERTLAIVGKHLPITPNGVLLTSRNAKSNLTQFILNLENVTRWARTMLDQVDAQDAIDWRKEKGL